MRDAKLIEKRWVATSTAEFILEKPDNFEFTAGQHFAVRILRESESEGEAGDNTHTFTIASCPDDETLSFVTRMRKSSYKKELDKIDIGDTLKISGPAGNLYLRNSGRTAILIAGGIGIAPFWSILQTRDGRSQDRPQVVLLYSNRRPQDAAFLRALENMAEEQDGFRMIATITQPDFAEINWSGETGKIDESMLQKSVHDLTNADFYIAGPPGMAGAMNELVLKTGVPGDQVFVEQFAGYEEAPED